MTRHGYPPAVGLREVNADYEHNSSLAVPKDPLVSQGLSCFSGPQLTRPIQRFGLSVILLLALHVAARADVDIWLSDIGTVSNGVQTGVHGGVHETASGTGQLYLWLRTNSAVQNLTGVELNLNSTNDSVLDFSSVTIDNPEHVIGGCSSSTSGCRWHFTTDTTPTTGPDEITGFNAGVITNGTGLGADGVTAGDSLFDATADAWLIATVDYTLLANGATDLYLQIGDNGIAGIGEEASDIDVVFGDPTDASLNAQTERNTNSATADSVFRVGGAYWDGDANVSNQGDGNTWADNNNWTTLGVEDQEPTSSFPGDAVIFATAPTVGSILLGSDRLAYSVKFEDDYTLNNHTLTLTSGNATVDPGISASIQSNITASNGTFSKLGSGTLSVAGTLSDTEVVAGVLQGTGTLTSLTMESGSQVAPGNSIGTLFVTNTYSQNAGSQLLIEVSGTTAGTQYDVLSANGAATLAGHLDIQTTDGFTPAAGATPGDFGDSFVVLSANSISGTFNTDSGRHVGSGRFYFISYNATNVTLDGFQALPGDANGDLKIDITDFNILSSNFSPGDNSKTWTGGDFDGDGDVDITDFNSLSSNFAPSGYGLSSSLAVPEPGISAMAVLLTIMLCRRPSALRY